MTEEQAKEVTRLSDRNSECVRNLIAAEISLETARENLRDYLALLVDPKESMSAEINKLEPNIQQPKRGRPKKQKEDATSHPHTEVQGTNVPSSSTSFVPDEFLAPTYMELLERLGWDKDQRQAWMKTYHGSSEFMRDKLFEQYPQLSQKEN